MGFTFSGTAKVIEDRKNGLWNMEAQAQDRRMGGSVHAVIAVAVTEPSPGITNLNVTADVQFMGKLGQMGQPLIKRKADSMIKEFAEGLKRTMAGAQN
jgi:carbon monoxide dehydrogenase subunit G